MGAVRAWVGNIPLEGFGETVSDSRCDFVLPESVAEGVRSLLVGELRSCKVFVEADGTSPLGPVRGAKAEGRSVLRYP